MIKSSSAFSDSKLHFKNLDALRGIAAIIVVIFHVLQIYSEGDHVKQLLNHGYLAVDFFFMLSGFVMAHAYDDRWDTMTVNDFFKRRVVRLHPMILLGMTIGGFCFYFAESDYFPLIEETSTSQFILVFIIGLTLIPIPKSMDIRGWNEMHPLNGPAWSLFLEYIANILHALVLRKLSKTVLSTLVFIAALALLHLAVTSPNGDVIGGWSIDPEQLRIGFTRLLFPYMAGMLLRRAVKLKSTKSTFILSSILLILFLIIPRIGGYDHLWANGLYDSLTIIIVFPIIIYIGAIGENKSELTNKICNFLGDISYPLYIIHAPFTYIFYAWVTKNNIPIQQGIWVGGGILIGTLFLSYVSLKLYDIPIRKFLAEKLILKKNSN